MTPPSFSDFFQGTALHFLEKAVAFALEEDGQELTSELVFTHHERMAALLVAKQHTLLCGLPIAQLVFAAAARPGDVWHFEPLVEEGSQLAPGQVVARMEGPAPLVLRAERTILNFIMRLSGVANTTRLYANELEGTGVTLLDTRKTTPCLRYPEKYAVLVGGGANHRKNLEEMLMLKDNHIDAAGSITKAVHLLRASHTALPPLEIECRTPEEVAEAVAMQPERIMLDNMPLDMLQKSLALVPGFIEVEVSGGVTLETIREKALAAGARKPDFISVGRLTHTAAAADFSIIINRA
ncbi:carboxylating nicotinate-nucleotide diphosphorylase [Desulfovibrio cuneatus]|uniref:carboxylating nicotinate-nucleotide diphosphorylase n=1 Tax=Desulfovibrio cuneatus TaxID=159728 RepID=UPI000419A364|nr:carboxylating nicotinate-nucleotide diphosphorylase [Desulfovibrio cuneatus]